MRIYEEVDRNLHEVEKANEQLKNESKADKEKVKRCQFYHGLPWLLPLHLHPSVLICLLLHCRLQETEQALEQRCEELQSKLDELRAEQSKREKQSKRTWSVPSLTEASDYHPGSPVGGGLYNEFQGFPSYTSRQEFLDKRFFDTHNIFSLKDTVRNLKAQLDREKRKNSDLSKETSVLVQENQALEARLSALENEQQKIGTLESELEAMEISAGKLCRSCGAKIMKMSIGSMGSDLHEGELYEHDNTEDIVHGELVRLKNGGSAYGSRESLNLIGLETDDVCMTPVVEVCRDILAAAVRDQQLGSDNGDDNDEPGAENSESNTEISILGELEEQYRSLVIKYETLIEAKSKKTAAKDQGTQDDLHSEPCGRPGHLAIKTESEAQTVSRRPGGLDLRSPLDPTDGHFENGPPEYKKLFKEMFQTLKRSVVYEDGLQQEEKRANEVTKEQQEQNWMLAKRNLGHQKTVHTCRSGELCGAKRNSWCSQFSLRWMHMQRFRLGKVSARLILPY